MTRLVVIGAGPAGLAAAERCRQLGHDDVVVLEATGAVGGLARSITDEAGFTYDIGGHVMFSGYEQYARLVDELLGDDVTEITREAWVWMQGRAIPYPFQDNIRGLEPSTVYDCVTGLIATQRKTHHPRHLHDWVIAVFGEGMARHFMLPYNHKVWATPLEEMAFGWIGQRVTMVDVERVLRNVILGEDHRSWGPNATFRYPRAGTGELWHRLADRVRHRVAFDHPVVSVDAREKAVTTADGRRWPYEALLSTMPLDELIARTEGAPAGLHGSAGRLRSIGTHVVAICVDRPSGTSRNWVYFPEPEVPFHRLTYLSNYSPDLTPEPDQTILLAEVSTTAPSRPDAMVDAVETGLRRVGVLRDGDRVVHRWHHFEPKSYPVPTLDRDEALATIEPWLARHDIASRGRFGSWRYELGNMDHAAMQGMEWVDRVLTGRPESVWPGRR